MRTTTFHHLYYHLLRISCGSHAWFFILPVWFQFYALVYITDTRSSLRFFWFFSPLPSTNFCPTCHHTYHNTACTVITTHTYYYAGSSPTCHTTCTFLPVLYHKLHTGSCRLLYIIMDSPSLPDYYTPPTATLLHTPPTFLPVRSFGGPQAASFYHTTAVVFISGVQHVYTTTGLVLLLVQILDRPILFHCPYLCCGLLRHQLDAVPYSSAVWF